MDAAAISVTATMLKSALMTNLTDGHLQWIMRKASWHCHVHSTLQPASRRSAMKRLFAALLLAAWSGTAQADFSVVEASIADMQQEMASGRVTSRQLVQQYLMRIGLYDRKLH